MAEDSEADLAASWVAHMERCMAAVLAPLSRPDVKVTIIVRAPEALPCEAMISSNDDLGIVRDSVAHFVRTQSSRRRDEA
ncbi:hypothetical protein GXW74_15710 [Roseomonas eburnea]|uniref:Uncharacterized protein n=1 Tax=Neoroseomonas eburnea TaxID=1346889 RepID=A0A9X9XE05_9PROT|nr:hypothetical protein [Neoroseomonas eburnea]MBR0681941.1 hypothetical protein [Neoroseomonas eburnea]